MNIKLTQFVKKQILSQAEDLLEELQESTKKQSSKTQQQRDLDIIFARHPNDPTWIEFADIVNALIGYRPTGGIEKRKNFQVVARCAPNTKPVIWIVLKSDIYGFAAITHGNYTLNPSDRIATLQEAEDFLESFEKVQESDLFNWILRQLGAETLSQF